MLVIIYQSGLYFHNKGRIILFESQQETQYFLELFSQYLMQKLAQDGQVMSIMQVPMILQGKCKIVPVNFDIDKVECGTVLASELFEKLR